MCVCAEAQHTLHPWFATASDQIKQKQPADTHTAKIGLEKVAQQRNIEALIMHFLVIFDHWFCSSHIGFCLRFINHELMKRINTTAPAAKVEREQMSKHIAHVHDNIMAPHVDKTG